MLLVERNPKPAHALDPTLTRFDWPSARRPGHLLRVDYRTDARCAFVRLPAGWLYVATPVGLENFPELARLVDEAPVRGLAATLAALERLRLLAFVAYDSASDVLYFGRSLDGFASLYFGGEPASLMIAEDRFAIAARLGSLRFSAVDEAAYCTTWSPPPEGSFLEDVRRAHAGVRYRAPLEGTLERHLMAPNGAPLGQNAAVDLLRAEMRRLCATYGTRRIALLLSGGVDSRVVLAGLMDAVREGILHRDQIVLTSVLFPGFDCDESALIGEIAHLSGFEWIGIEATPQNVAAAFEQTLRQDSPPFPTAFMSRLCMNQARERGAQIILTGHGGDEIFDYDLVDVVGRSWLARMRLWNEVRALRGARGFVDEIKSLAVTAFGRRAMRQLRGALQAQRFSASNLHAFRLGRRLGAASGTGYEASAAEAVQQGLYMDVPLYRAALFPRLDPVGYHHIGGRYKAVARAYLHAVTPDIARVPTRKVVFDEAVHTLLPPPFAPPPTRPPGPLDAVALGAYVGDEVFRAWRTRIVNTRGLA